MVIYPGDWEVKKLGDIVDIVRGASPRPIESFITLQSDGVNWIKISDAPKNGKYITHTGEKITKAGALHSVSVDVGDLILSNSMSFGRPYILKISGCIHDGWLKLYNLFSSVNREFLCYVLSSQNIYKQYVTFAAGSGVQNLNKNVVKNVVIPLPTLKEQTAIAETLAAFDTHITNLTELITKKKAIRDGALDELMTGQTRLYGFCGDWEVKTLGESLKVRRGKRVVRRQLSTKGNFPVYQNSLATLGFFDRYNCEAHSAFIIAAGNAGDVGFSETHFWAADDCYYFDECKNIEQKFLYYMLLHHQRYIYTQTRRTSIPRLSHDILEDIIISLPPLDEQKAIADTLSALDKEISSLETERAKISQIRDGAMNDLLTGKVRLKIGI